MGGRVKVKEGEACIYLFLMRWHGTCICFGTIATKKAEPHEELVFVGRREADEGG